MLKFRPVKWIPATAAALMLMVCSAVNAAVLISDSATRHMSCVGGVCTPTGKKATLNAADLAAMLAGGDVTVKTGSGAVTITVVSTFSWTSPHKLTLDAQENVSFRAPVAVPGKGAVTITTGDGIPGGALIFFPGGSVDFWDDASSLIINGMSYTLVNDVATLAADIAADPSGAYALARNCDASSDGVYARSPVPTPLTGTVEGLGHTIENLAINDTVGFDMVGLFADIGTGGVVRDLALTSVDLAGNDASMGSLAGEIEAGGTVAGASASGTASGGSGLVGRNAGTIVDSNARVTVINGFFDAGLVGSNSGTILRCRAAGSVTNSTPGGGGLVYFSNGTIQDSSADVSVVSPDSDGFAGTDTSVGGLVGRAVGGSISGSFATGDMRVEGTAPGSRNNHSFALLGGLVGWDEGAAISDSYATGKIVFVATGTNGNRVGGLVGEADVPVLRSYSTGMAKVTKARNGGFAGTAPSSGMSADYWDLDTSGIADPSRGVGSPRNDPGVTGLSDAALKSGLPVSFDPSVWAQRPGINNGYPYLIANPPQ